MSSLPTSPYALKVPIDPRIRQRRIEVRRDQGRRRLRVLVGLVVLVVLSTAGWAATRSPLLDVDAVEVEGATRTPPAAIREAAGLDRGRPMVEVNGAAAVRAIEALPWVAEAWVLRRWPGTVSITVTERTPLAATVDSEARWWLLDRFGRVLEEGGARPPDLPVVEGMEAVPPPGQVVAGAEPALRVSSSLSPSLRARVDAVVLVGGGVDLRLKGEGGPPPVVQLGGLDHLDQKLRAAESVLASVDRRGLATLDVRFPASPVLTRL